MIVQLGADRICIPDGFSFRAPTPLGQALATRQAALLHDLELVEWRTKGSALAIKVRDSSAPSESWIYYPREAVQAVTFEDGDHVDAIIQAGTIQFSDGTIACRGELLWPTINYVGQVNVNASGHAYKPDHEQAVLFKSGERHERSAATALRALGHDVQGPAHTGRIVIVKDPNYKRQRKPDLRCFRCQRRFEVKSFLKPPIRVRVSDSPSRPWSSENAPDDFHVFAHGDDVKIVSNAAILKAWSRGGRTSGRYDHYWLIDNAHIAFTDVDSASCAVAHPTPS